MRRGSKLALFTLTVTLFNSGVLRPTYSAKASYKASKDFIYHSTLRSDILYNPRYIQIAKKIDLDPLSKSIIAIKDLLSAYNRSCAQQENWYSESQGAKEVGRKASLGFQWESEPGVFNGPCCTTPVLN